MGAWWVRRSAIRSGVLAGIAMVVAAATVLISVILGIVDRGTTDGVRDYLHGLDDSSITVSFATTPASDGQAQDAAAHRLIEGALAGLPADVRTRSISPRLQVTAGPVASGTALRLGVYSGATDHAGLVAGGWPTTATDPLVDIAVPQELAARWGIGVGAQLAVAVPQGQDTAAASGPRATLRVVGVYRPDDSGFWTASRALVSGAVGVDATPIVQVAPVALDTALVSSLGGPLVGWTVVPDIDRLSADQVPTLRAAVTAFSTTMRTDRDVDNGGTLVAGDLGTSLESAAAAVSRSAAAAPLPLTLVVVFCLVMLLQLGRLLADERRGETVLLVSRGLSARRAAWWATLEVVAVAALGALVGLLVAASSGDLRPAVGWSASAAVVVAVLAVAAPARQEAAAPLLRDRADDSGRARVLVAGGLVLLAVGAAVFAWWRFDRASPTPTGSPEPAVLLAPAAILTAGALVVTVAFGVLVRLAARVVAARDRGVGRSLPIRQVARRATVFGAVVLLLGLAVGGTAIAAAYGGSVATLEQAADRLRVGPDVRIDGVGTDVGAADGAVLPSLTALPGVRAALPVMSVDVGDLDRPRVLDAIDVTRLARVVAPVDGFDPATLAAALAPDPLSAAALPTGAALLRVSAQISTSTRLVAGVQPVAWWSTDSGQIVRQEWPEITPQSRTVQATPPPTARSLVAVDLLIPRGDQRNDVTVLLTVRALDRSGAVLDSPMVDRQWSGRQIGQPEPADRLDTTGSTVSALIAARATRASSPFLVRFLPADTQAAGSPIPAAVSAAAAATTNLALGDVVVLDVAGSRVQVRVSMVVPTVPGLGTGEFFLTDLAALQRQLLLVGTLVNGPTSVWVGSDRPIESAAAARGVLGAGPSVTAIGVTLGLTSPAVRAYWWGAAGAAVLAVGAFAVVLTSLAQRRRGEVTVLTALGIRPARQAVLRRRELFVAAGCGLIGGAVVSVVAVWVVIPRLAVRSVIGGQDVRGAGVVLQTTPLVVVLGVQALVVVGLVLLAGRDVRRTAAAFDARSVIP